MTNDKNSGNDSSKNQSEQNKEQEHVQNPFEPSEGKEITQEDIDNEQKFKEALSERD